VTLINVCFVCELCWRKVVLFSMYLLTLLCAGLIALVCVFQVSALDVDIIEVDPDTKEMLKSLVSIFVSMLF